MVLKKCTVFCIPAATEDQGNSDEEFYDSPEHPVECEVSCSPAHLTGVGQENDVKDRTEYQSIIQPTVVSFTETEILTDGTLCAEGGASESDHSSLTSPEILEFPPENDGSQWDTAEVAKPEPSVGDMSASDRIAAGKNAYAEMLAELRRKSEELKGKGLCVP